MALFIQNNNDRSKFSERIAAEVTERAKQRAKADAEQVDGVNDSQYLKNTKPTTSLAWIWVIIILVGVIVAIWAINQSK